jgi:hypothetical protein
MESYYKNAGMHQLDLDFSQLKIRPSRYTRDGFGTTVATSKRGR